MVTATDDINSRLAAVEAEIHNINVRLAVLEADIRNINTQLAEINANQRQLHDRIDRLEQNVNIRIDALNARIERVFWAVISVGIVTGAGIVGTMLTLIIRTT